MDVTDILRDRTQEPDGFQRMISVSIALHVAVAAFAVFGPGHWLQRASEEPRQIMTISLGGGGEGPRTGGMTKMGGQPVQVQRSPEEAPKREAARPPAVKPPEMVMPTKTTKPSKASPAPDIKQAPDQARGRTPTRGAQVTPGTAIADTGVRGQGFGLATGGGPGSGSRLDVADFCCPEYVLTMMERIRSGWVRSQGTTGVVIVKFTIQRDGRITDDALDQSSGSPVLDLAALRAVKTTRALPPLPSQFPNPTLTVYLSFEYQ